MATAKKTTPGADAFDAMSAINPEMFKDGYEKATQSMTAFAEMQKASMEALMASAGSVAKGVEEFASEGAAFAKEAFEESVAAAKATATSKSVQEAFDVQNDYVRTSFEKSLQQLNKSAEHWISVAKEASQPITEQYGSIVEKVQTYRP
ncbi:MAG: phasin family protein [Pseudomonadota bacterium]